MAYKYNGIDITTLMEPRGSFNTMDPDFPNYLVTGSQSLYQQYTGRMYLTNPLGGTYRHEGVAIDPAGIGTLPKNTLFHSITTAGTYSITRTDSVLQIGSTRFYPSNFSNNAIPKVIGIAVTGGGGGGGGAGGAIAGGGGGGGGAGSAIGVINLTYGTVSVTVGAAGSSGSGGGGVDQTQTSGGQGGRTTVSVGGTVVLYGNAGWGGGRGGGGGSGGSGAAGGGTTAADLSDFNGNKIATRNGGNAGDAGADGSGTTDVMAGYLSQAVSTTLLSFSKKSGGDCDGGSGYGGGGGASALHNGGDGAPGNPAVGADGDDGTTGSGGGGGSAGTFTGGSGGSGGSGAVYFYY